MLTDKDSCSFINHNCEVTASSANDKINSYLFADNKAIAYFAHIIEPLPTVKKLALVEKKYPSKLDIISLAYSYLCPHYV
jgi:hypothetical protein